MPSQNLLRYRRPTIGKPPLGAVIDWSHPMSYNLKHAFLFNEGSGDVHDLVTGNPGALRSVSTTHQWRTTIGGPAILGDGVDGADINVGEGNLAHGNGNVSVYVQLYNVGGSNSALGSMTGTSIDAYAWTTSGGGGTNHMLWVLSTVGSGAIDSGLTLSLNVPISVGYAYTKSTQCFFYTNNFVTGATQTATISSALVPVAVTGQVSTLMSDRGLATSTCNGQLFLTYIWGNRLLTQAEFRMLDAAPYDMFYSPAQRFRSVQSIVTTTTLPIFVQC